MSRFYTSAGDSAPVWCRDDQIYQRIAQILEQARGQVARTVNTAMVHAYWHIGREIVAITQEGEARARYGNEVVKNLAKRLQRSYGKGFSLASLFRMRQFYLALPMARGIQDKAGAIFSTPLRILTEATVSPTGSFRNPDRSKRS